MDDYSIGEVARQADISPATLRFYEQIGLAPAARRRNGRRRYDASMAQRVTFIKMAQQAGFTLTEIHAIFYAFPQGTPLAARWDAMAPRKSSELTARLVELERMQSQLHAGPTCTCLTLEECPVASSGTTSHP